MTTRGADNHPEHAVSLQATGNQALVQGSLIMQFLFNKVSVAALSGFFSYKVKKPGVQI